ncbi:hypothetical protein CRE_05982 [Caenorhabditis remanei]|uniref:Uncharacterized protein n=1 Tax=Caenorhabditis remanei TaxID=31234 RepID=E3MZD3_CAERE|nr:hypothetical protein CRE_05982 [Caenorhabditis remanei]
MTPKTKRNCRVCFSKVNEYREFGNTDYDSTSSSSGSDMEKKILDTAFIQQPERSSSAESVASYSIDSNENSGLCLDVAFLGKPTGSKKRSKKSASKRSHANDSMLAHDGRAEPWTVSPRAKFPRMSSPKLWATAVRLLKMRAEKRWLAKASERVHRKSTMSQGISWKKPTALKVIRQDWRFPDEMESEGDNPADNEMAPTSPTKKKKRLLTRRERFIKEVAQRSLKEKKRVEELRRLQFKEKLSQFIEKVKQGKVVKSIFGQDNEEADENKKFLDFAVKRSSFVKENKADPKKVDFKVRAGINRRLKSHTIGGEVRLAYEIVLENYDSALGLHFTYLFLHKKDKRFLELEKMFLLNY